MILKGQEGSLTTRLYLWKTTTCSNTLHLCDFRLCLNAGICYAGLPDYGMRNTLSIVCTRTLLAEAFPLSFSALYCHSLCGFGRSRFVLVVSVPRKRPLQTAHSRPQCLRVWECARKLWETLRRSSQNLAI